VPGTFYEQPILNSPYSEPVYHHPLDEYGQPLEQPAILGRRTSKFIVPVPKSRKATAAAQASLDLETYTPNSLINEIRGYVNAWRNIPNPADWGVTPASARLLDYWRNHQFSSVRPLFCQVEAVETIIWLTEVAPIRGRNLTCSPRKTIFSAIALAIFAISLKRWQITALASSMNAMTLVTSTTWHIL
jgi:type III restriction enzyme